MKKAPIKKVSANHSRNPHFLNCHNVPVRDAWNLSAAKTPNWQVTDESTRTVVLTAANGMLSSAVDSAQIFGPCTERVVKYIAKSAAKNINSLESQTIVPTATIFGRFTFLGIEVGLVTVLDMEAIIPDLYGNTELRGQGEALFPRNFGETHHARNCGSS